MRSYCCVIPARNNGATVHDVIRRTKAVTPHILVIDDASEDEDLAAYYAGTDVEVIRHAKPEGPGGVFRTAVNILSGQGFSCMITMDPTGQCFPEDLPRFFSYLHEKEEPTITIGCRDFFVPANLKAPDLHNRKLANFLFRLETGLKTTDALSGFCAYPVHYIKRLKIKNNVSDFQTELLIRAIWANLKIRSLRVRFAPLHTEKQRKPDLLTNLKLIGLRLLPCPKQTLRSREKFDFSLFHPKQFFSYLLKENATPGELAAAAFTGTYCAVLPLFGLHTPVVLYFATVFRLNRFLAFMIQHPFVLLPVTPFLCIELGYFIRHGVWLTDFNWQTLGYEIALRAWEWVLGSLILAPVFSVLSAIITYFSAAYLQKRIRLKFWADSRKWIAENESGKTDD